MTPALQSWIEKAVNAYYRDRIINVLANVGTLSSSAVLTLWNETLDDMYGDDKAIKEERKESIIEMVLKEESVSQDAKDWLRALSQS